jgi:hypothetical protein
MARFFSIVVILAAACTPPARTEHDSPGAPLSRTSKSSSLTSVGTLLAAPLPPRRPGAYANLDPDDDYVVGPPDALPDCEAELTKAGVKHGAASIPVHTEKKSKIVCGAPQLVTYHRGPGNIAYEPSPVITCQMALALASFEKIVQEEAQRIFGSPVVRAEQLGTYSCREVARFKGTISEHSYANAIDLSHFVLKNAKTVDVLRDFDMGDDPPKRPAGAFLRVISRRANDEDVFSHVLTPFWNRGHKNHFHLDLARYRSDGTRPDAS